ncbi:MAG TPA: SseB family protein, partial [Pilimelia sp.]|nr:SseB family protein [Pilimelia sp.]
GTSPAPSGDLTEGFSLASGPEPPTHPGAARAADRSAEASPPPAAAEFTPANEVEANLLTAAGEGSTDAFLTTLLLARVLVPVAGDAPTGVLPGDEKFSWLTDTIDGEPYVVVFTSLERLVDHLGAPVETVSVKFVQLIQGWPDPSWSFAVNPGTPVGATLPGKQIVALASWATEVGLGADGEAETADAAPRQSRPEPSAHRAPRDAGRPTVMQKVVQPAQVDYYLDRGYDRVSGFVHRASEVAGLRTPATLIAALGLRHPGSPFPPDANELHVIRWPAHRPSLYRIPYGGQTQTAMRAMEGWVIERPPFRGNGFAPGDSGEVIAEFKVDSVRLPHGAELWRIGGDGAEQLVAVLDVDRSAWRRVGER